MFRVLSTNCSQKNDCALTSTVGAQINERTNNGKGGTALWWAEKRPKENRAAILVLKKHGAVSVAPGAAVDDEE